jgi:glycosyltransferase involved in cell wall biosynthesis
LSREKRHDLVLQAIARSRHRQRILFVATGKGPLQSSLEKQVRALGIQSRIGYVDDCRLLELLNSSDLMVHASEAELEGMAVLEAIGCGLPVLIARAKNSAASQFAIDERFLFEAGAVEQLRDRLDYWIEHPEELAQAGQTYLVKSRQFGFDGALRQLESLLAKMAGVALAPSDDSATIASGAEIA